MYSQPRNKQINLKHRSPRRQQMEIVNPFKPLCNLFRRQDPIQKSRERVIQLQNEIRGEQARQLYLSGQNDPKIREYIRQRFQTYLKMEYAPSIPVACPHCNSNIVLNPNCTRCGWALSIHFRDMVSNGHLLATPTLNAPIRKGESLIFENQIPYNKNQMVTIYQKEREHEQYRPLGYKKAPPKEEVQIVRFYPNAPPLEVHPAKEKLRQRPRRPSVDSDASGFISPRKIYRSVSDVVQPKRKQASVPAKILEPDRVVRM